MATRIVSPTDSEVQILIRSADGSSFTAIKGSNVWVEYSEPEDSYHDLDWNRNKPRDFVIRGTLITSATIWPTEEDAKKALEDKSQPTPT